MSPQSKKRKAKRFAEGTSCSISASKGAIEQVIRKNGGTSVLAVSDDDAGRSGVQFRAYGRVVQVGFPHPTGDDPDIYRTRGGVRRNAAGVELAIDAEIRRRWRCVLLIVKASFEIVESGIADFDHVFLPYLLGPDGRTVAETVTPQIAAAYESAGVDELVGLNWTSSTADEVLVLGPGPLEAGAG